MSYSDKKATVNSLERHRQFLFISSAACFTSFVASTWLLLLLAPEQNEITLFAIAAFFRLYLSGGCGIQNERG